VTLELHVTVALDHSLLTSLHRCIAPVGIGSFGAEGLAAAHLTSSLDNNMSNAPMPLSDTSVKPMLLSFPHLAEYARPNALMQGHRCIRQPSVAPMVGHRFNRCSWLCIFSSNSSRRSFESLKYILSLDFHYSLAALRLIGLVILMVDWTWRLDEGLNIASWQWIRRVELLPWELKILQVWSHKQWPRWGHVSYNLPFFCDSWQHNQSKYKIAKIDKLNHLRLLGCLPPDAYHHPMLTWASP